MKLENDVCSVQISVDSTYTMQSADNKYYDIELNPDNYTHSDFYKVLAIHINVFDGTIDIAFVGNFYSYDIDCAHLDGYILTILQNDMISQIKVTDGTITFHKRFDCFGCTYGLYRVPNGYIVYGEIEIVMLDLQFNKKCSFLGRDIFVSCSSKKAFEICETSIHLYDWQNNYYEIDFNGNLLCERISSK